ncbi:MAG: STAS/SEC14 domain-containing protein [Chloroflexota bacterium]
MSKVMVQPNLVLDVDDIVNGVAQMATHEFEQFVEKVMALRISRRVPSLSKRETELIQKINEGVPDEVRLRFRFLRERMLDETISPDEYEELIKLTEQIEVSDSERMINLVELSQLRNVSLETVMEQLDIQTPAYD